MASLRRLASLDTIPNSCSNPAPCTSRLTRHSSLPNLFLGEPELSFKALRVAATVSRSFSFYSFESGAESLRSCKLPLCRALSAHSSDELPYFNIPAVDACRLFAARPFDVCGAGAPPAQHGLRNFPRKEALVAVGKQGLDLQQSIVYNELKESMWKLEAPARFLRPSSSEANPSLATNTHIHTHIHGTSKTVKSPNLCMESSSRAGVKGRPLSLRMLKRKLSQGASQADCNEDLRRPRPTQPNQKYPMRMEPNHGLSKSPHIFSDVRDSVSSAFASLFYILKMLQLHSHSLRIRSQPSSLESDRSCYENLAGRACAEMLDSFLWMFQQVFSCTPELMLLTMVLLADFTLHSMSMHVALPNVRQLGEPSMRLHVPLDMQETAVAEAADIDAHDGYQHGHDERRKVRRVSSKKREGFLPGVQSGVDEISGNTRRAYRDSNSEGAWQTGGGIVGADTAHGGVTLSSLPASLLHDIHEKTSEFSSGRNVGIKLLVAPLRAPTLETDDYPCFDRTDLAYQREISMDPSNPLLLANYAQFLQLVRRDYGRAEELYRRAVRAEAEVDGDVMGRFASFLWVAKGDVAEADKAFKAAAVADPTNAFHAGNYAHFLWNSSAGQA